jgi:hypothetical protein
VRGGDPFDLALYNEARARLLQLPPVRSLGSAGGVGALMRRLAARGRAGGGAEAPRLRAPGVAPH